MVGSPDSDGEGGADAYGTFHADLALHDVHDALDQRQSKTVALFCVGGCRNMDYTDIITAVIAAGAAIGGSMLSQSKATAVLQTKLDALKSDVGTLSERVNKHNNLVERMAKVECKIEDLEKKGS